MERLVREAANPARRTFRAEHELEHWLSETLTPDERTALSVFLQRR
jgi:hypothetical protein